MAVQTTALYAAALASLGMVLWVRVAMMRSQLKVSIGDGGYPALHERIRQYGNFIEWTPWVIVLMALAEANGAGSWWLHASGGLLLAGRLIHPFGLKADDAGHALRYVGNTASLLALLGAVAYLLIGVLRP